jgi:hypothetical protein
VAFCPIASDVPQAWAAVLRQSARMRRDRMLVRSLLKAPATDRRNTMNAAMSRRGITVLLTLACLSSAGLSACEKKTPAEKVGDKIEKAGDKIEDKLDEAN